MNVIFMGFFLFSEIISLIEEGEDLYYLLCSCFRNEKSFFDLKVVKYLKGVIQLESDILGDIIE